MAITLDKALQAVEDSKGNHTTIAKSLGCSRSNISKLRLKWTKFDDAVKEAKDSRTDWVESRLDDRIKDGDTTAIIFYLKTQGKDRGYVEKQEVDHTTGGEPLGKSLEKSIEKIYGNS